MLAVLIQSPSEKGRLKKSMNPERKFWEICWAPKPRPIPAPPSSAPTAAVETPKVTISAANVSATTTMVKTRSSKAVSMA